MLITSNLAHHEKLGKGARGSTVGLFVLGKRYCWEKEGAERFSLIQPNPGEVLGLE